MKHSLKYAERGIQLKVLDISEHICHYGSNQLRKFGIQKGTVLEIDPPYVSQVLIDLQGRDVLLGYESAQMILIGGKRLTELKTGESGQLSDFEGGYEVYRRFRELGMKEGTEIILKAYPYLGEQYVKLQGVKIMKNNMRELLKLPIVEYIIVDVKGLEKQVSLMGISNSNFGHSWKSGTHFETKITIKRANDYHFWVQLGHFLITSLHFAFIIRIAEWE